MSAQLLTAMLQAPFSKLGQLVIEPHPIDASESSSPVPQIPSAPPQWALRRRWSFACALAMEERGQRVGMAVGVRGHAPQDLAVLALAERLHLRLDELRGFLRDRALASQGLAQDGARGKEQHLRGEHNGGGAERRWHLFDLQCARAHFPRPSMPEDPRLRHKV